MENQLNVHKLSDTVISNLECTARIARILAHRFFDENEDFGVTFNEFMIIDALNIKPGIHQRDLAKILFKGTANLSRDLEKLEKRGLIKRAVNTKDKRIVKTLMLTQKGQKVYHDVGICVNKHLVQIESIFSPQEHEMFLSFILRLKDRLTDSEDMIFE